MEFSTMIKKDQMIGAGLVLVGIFFGVMTSQFSMPLTAEYPGPKMLPTLAVFGLIVCGIGIFVQSTLKNAKEKVFLGKDGWIRGGLTFGILVLYVLGLKYIGYMISTPILLYVLATLFAKGRYTRLVPRIVYSVSFSILVYLVYVQLFKLSLPAGSLFQG